jgi:hypothetical protein
MSGESETFLTESLEKELIKLPEQIADFQYAILNIQQDIEAVEDELKLIREAALEKILSEKESGKPKYSNEEQRKLALARMLTPDELYNNCMDKLRSLKTSLRGAEIKEEKTRNLFRAYQAIAMLRGKL